MEPKNSFTICVLLYGKHTNLAHRCLSSLARACPDALPTHLRLGLNAISDRTEKYVQSLIDNGWVTEDNIWRSAENIHKYPMMRRMLYDPDKPVTTPFVMWFDDDSYIKEEMVGANPSFLQRVLNKLEPPANLKAASAAMCGSIYTVQRSGNQEQWIKDQSWYGGKPVPTKLRFATGGWWAARYEVLKKFNYPWPQLDHRGGDVMLGQLMHQQSLNLTQFRDGLAINADENGNESRAERRGFDQTPIGVDYVPGRQEPPPQETPPAESPTKPRLIDRLDL